MDIVMTFTSSNTLRVILLFDSLEQLGRNDTFFPLVITMGVFSGEYE